jgi:hypothetical protein
VQTEILLVLAVVVCSSYGGVVLADRLRLELMGRSLLLQTSIDEPKREWIDSFD